MTEGFAIRNRGAHLPDHVRRLELISNSPVYDNSSAADPDKRGSTFRPLAKPQFNRDLVARFEHAPKSPSPLVFTVSGGDAHKPPPPTSHASHDDLANVFGNLSVWIDASLHKCAFHAGFDKIRIYALFLRCFLDDLLPQDTRVQRALLQLDAYVRYLSSSSQLDPLAHHVSSSQAQGLPSASPRQLSLRTDRLSPKTSYQSAALVPHMLSPRATQQSPRQYQQQASMSLKAPQQRSYPTRKKIVHMSDHEEHILELALYFEETLRKMGGPQSSSKTKSSSQTQKTKNKDNSSSSGAVELTTQWLLLSSDEKHRVLRRRKRQLARHEFFPCASVYNSSSSSELELISTLISARAPPSGAQTSTSSRPIGGPGEDLYNHKMELASYFSLVMLCLHEAIRRVSVFSLELAEFAWKVLCDDALALCEDMFATILRNQRHAQTKLRALKLSKAALQQQIMDLEGEIQRLQTQNMRSLTVCNLEKQEFLHLEREEQWHGHCKALIVGCVAQLQSSVKTPAWLQKTGLPLQIHDEGDETEEGEQPQASGGDASHQKHRLSDYQRLAPGFATFHFHNRFQVIYVAHLALLCRSYLHLHERRGVRDVMSSTSINTSSSSLTTGDTVMDHLFAQPGTDDWHSSQSGESGAAPTTSFFLGSAALPHRGSLNSMEKISLSELHTLREINDALRAIEVLYAETGATSSSEPTAYGESVTAKKPKLRRPRALQRSFGTQFPVMGADNAHSFLRSLSYCTIAATTFSSSTHFSPAGASAKLQREIEAHHEKVVVTPMGSGRRRSSVRFKDASEASASANAASGQHQEPQMRLNKALRKLPRHLRDLLVLTLVLKPEASASEDDQFPASDPARSIATCLAKHDLVDKIHWIYCLALDNAYASGFSSLIGSVASDLLPISLAANHLQAGSTSSMGSQAVWTTCESFVEFVYCLFFEAEGGDLERCEREFVRFFASVQYFLGTSSSSATSGSAPSSSGPGTSSGGPFAGASLAHETISLFALLTKLVHLQSELGARNKEPRGRKALPSRVFGVLFYCQRVLLHVSVTKKLIENSGFSMDVWALQSAEDMNNWGRRAPVAAARPVVSSSPSKRAQLVAPATGSGSTSSTPFVLLESAKALLLHVVSFAFAPDVAALLEEKYQFLLDKSVVATVSLVTLVSPGPYNLSSLGSVSSASSSSSSAGNAPNGQLAEVQILPMDLAISTIVHCWVHVHFSVERQLGLTLQGALMDDDGRLAFEEFVHVMAAQAATNGAQGSGSTSTLSRVRLAQIYAAAQAKTSESSLAGSPGINRNSESPHWRQLLGAIVDNVDILGMHERFLSVDFRSIQQSLLAPASSLLGSFPLTSWLLGSSASSSRTTSNSNGSTQALVKSWQLHHKAMRDHIALTFQAESALDGVHCWQTASLRLDKVQRLLAQATRTSDNSSSSANKKRRSAVAGGGPGATENVSPSEKETAVTAPNGNAPPSEDEEVHELERDLLSVAWKAYQLLQWDHARAHQFADQVRVKQQRLQKNASLLSSSLGTTAASATAAGIAGPTPAAQQQLVSPGKAEEIRPQRPTQPTKTAAQRPQRS